MYVLKPFWRPDLFGDWLSLCVSGCIGEMRGAPEHLAGTIAMRLGQVLLVLL